jgi:hypothetical protein
MSLDVQLSQALEEFHGEWCAGSTSDGDNDSLVLYWSRKGRLEASGPEYWWRVPLKGEDGTVLQCACSNCYRRVSSCAKGGHCVVSSLCKLEGTVVLCSV